MPTVLGKMTVPPHRSISGENHFSVLISCVCTHTPQVDNLFVEIHVCQAAQMKENAIGPKSLLIFVCFYKVRWHKKSVLLHCTPASIII